MGLGEVIGYSFSQGILLSIITVCIGWYTVYTSQERFTMYAWIIIPVLSYLISLGLLTAVNFSACESINLPLVATSSVFTFVAVVFFLVVSWFGFFKNFIIPILPVSLQAQFGTIAATAFFIFWAGMYGGAFGYGFAQSCPK